LNNEELLSEAKNIWDSAMPLVEMYEARWVTNKKLVQSQHITARRPGQSNLFVPKIESFHQRKQADFLQAYGGESNVALKPTLTSTKNGARIMERLVNYYIHEAGGINWDAAVLNLNHNALTYNYAPWLLDWNRGVAIEEDENGEKIEVETHSFPTLEVVPPEDFAVDPSVGWDEINQARFAAVRLWRDKAYADEMAENGTWPEVDEGHFTDEFGATISQLKIQRKQGGTILPSQVSNALLEIHKFFFFHDLGDGLEPVVMTTTSDHSIILEEPERLEIDFADADGTDPWPFGIAKQFVEPHEVFSRAMPEKLESMQIEANAIRNQRRDNVAQVLNREKFMTPSAGVDPAQLSRSYAGKVTVVNTRDSVWWDAPPDVTQSSYVEEQNAVNDMQLLVGESAQRLGGETKRKETATQAKLTATNAAIAVSLDTKVFGMTFAQPFVKKLIRAIRQIVEPDMFIKAAEAEGIEVEDPYFEALTGEYQIIVGSGALQAEKDAAISNAANIAAILQSVYGPNANYYPIMSKVLEAMDLSPDDVIPDPKKEQEMAQNPAFSDLGGLQGEDNLTVQPNVQMSGGQFGSSPTEDGTR